MKKILIVSLVTANICAFAYTEMDTHNANFLAHESIINIQATGTNYRLDDTITRAEVVGIALKIKGVNLPSYYMCKSYFLDVQYDKNNNWICRAVETAADLGLISKNNKTFRPQDKITRSEALSIIAKAVGIKINSSVEELNSGKANNLNILFSSGRYGEFKARNYASWQTNLLLSIPCKIYTNFSCGQNYPDNQIDAALNFYANTKALRKDVINYATNILIQLEPKQLGVLYFQQLNDIAFEVPKDWIVKENWALVQAGPKNLKLSFNTGNEYSQYNLNLSILESNVDNTHFTPPPYTAPHDSIDYTKKQIKIDGLAEDSLEYKAVIADAAGISTRMEWYIFIGNGKILQITGWLKIRDEEDYSNLLPDIEKMIHSMTNT